MRAAVYLRHETVPLPEADAAFLEKARRRLPGIDWTECRDEGRFLAALPASRIAVVWRIEPGWIDNAPELDWIATPAAGGEFIRVPPRPGLAVTHGTFHGELIAETVLGLMLAFARGVKPAIEMRSGNPWPRKELTRIMRPLRGGRAVILGFGHIGKRIGGLLKGLGLAVTGVNRTSLAHPDYFGENDRVAPLEELDRELPRADHLILALPAAPDTDLLVNPRRLALLPATAYVYNVGRGNAIDETALAAALRERRLAGAGLDVYRQEPLPADSPLRKCGNVILLPHVSAMSPNYLDLFLDEFVRLAQARYPELRRGETNRAGA